MTFFNFEKTFPIWFDLIPKKEGSIREGKVENKYYSENEKE